MARYKKNDYHVKCDLSGVISNASEMKEMWNGLFVRKELWSRRHPQQKLPTIKENRVPQNPRPEGAEQFIDATDVTKDDL